MIEATTIERGTKVLWNDEGGWTPIGMALPTWDADELSDVRVIVDADGNVVPPPITDEMVERAAMAMFSEEQCDKRQAEALADNWMGRLSDFDRDEYRGLASAALTAAVRGAS